MKTPGRVLGLLGGLLLLDVLLDLPGFTANAVVGSLLAPSIDLLVVCAILVTGAQAGESGRRPLRIVALAVLLLLGLYSAGKRFGLEAALLLFGTTPRGTVEGWVAEAASCLVSLLFLAAAAALGWIATGLVVRGLETRLARSLFIALVAITAILQVVTGNRVLSPSAVPRIARDIAAMFG